MPLEIQKFLRNIGTPEDLKQKYAIDFKRHTDYPNLILFKYNMIDSPMGETIVQEARSIILDELDDRRVVSRSFDKFFNLGEGHHPKLPENLNDSILLEKVDGSLMVLYHYNDAWMVQSSGSPDAAGQVHDADDLTFNLLFWRTFAQMGLKLPEAPFHELCFAFELTSPYNRIVVQHDKPNLTLIGVRNRVTGAEFNPLDYNFMYPSVKSFIPKTVDEIRDSFKTMSPVSQEGYVLLWRESPYFPFNRVKIKHPGYVALHHMRDSTTDKAFVEVIRSGESSELLTYFPEYTERFNAALAKYNRLATVLELEYNVLKGIESQKEFALAAIKSPVSAALFKMRAGKIANIKQFLAAMPIDKLMDAMEKP